MVVSKMDLLRVGRGIGLVTLDPDIERVLVACWNEGLMRRDDVRPYTFTTQDGVVSDAEDEEDPS